MSESRPFIRIPTDVMRSLTDVTSERNVYVHRVALARAIFWQRLRAVHRVLRAHTEPTATALDLGGGSGAFLPTLAGLFESVSVVDLELDDARKLARHYNLGNVRFFENDIRIFDEGQRHDVMVATDVLEHFEDLDVPYQFLARHIRPGGVVAVSLPTENWIYEVGRRVIGKTKPVDHYHPARTVVDFFVARGFTEITRQFVPHWMGFAVPLFYIGLWRAPQKEVAD